ncbi:hybrid sensor histidine kinase/response regulator [Adhaeretor mobilis]|uniref:histidine kinase n=1 Tax=Adhaeretor mobilis TaxID=1930276 RepID=A0A517N2E2_9BACT|nr:ATP-binding protein [Adhaeretor mobilis]QDT01320.1 Autoinducer 2 sensor kinase/phosphatase LuxQ [Adhaeretor mobilis]
MIETEQIALQDVEARFRSTFENAAVGIAHVAVDGRWLRVNDKFCQIVEYTRDELLATDFQRVTHPDDLADDMQRYRQLVAGEIKSYSIQKRYVKKSGIPIWINLTVSMQLDEASQPLYAIAFVQDISQRKQFEAELTESIASRDRFLAMLSHELRNPLAAVLSAIRVINKRTPEGALSREAQVILRQSEHISRLLDDLLDVARITKDRLVLDLQVWDLVQLAKAVYEANEPMMTEVGHHFEFDWEVEPIWIRADSTRILQVIENLLTNAMKYTPAGGEIEMTVECDRNEAILAVIDNGRGIEKQKLKSIFEMFVQLEPNMKQSHGLGVGLTLVQALAEMHGGHITAESDGIGKGSRFELHLPLIPAVEASEARQQSMQEQSMQEQGKQQGKQQGRNAGAVSSEKPCRIVLVEDQQDAREMLAQLLEMDGYQVITAEDGVQGLATILSEKPDVALVDIALPGLDGYQIAQQVRATLDSSEVCMVALTGFGGAHDREAVLAAGFNEHLVKPVDPVALNRVIKSRAENRD